MMLRHEVWAAVMRNMWKRQRVAADFVAAQWTAESARAWRCYRNAGTMSGNAFVWCSW